MNNTLFWKAAIPVIVSFVMHKIYLARRRDKESIATPPKFNIWFWIQDNWMSATLHMCMWYVIIDYTQPIIDFLTNFKHTPEQIKHIIELAPVKIIYFSLGWLSAEPLTKLEKKLRTFKKYIISFLPKR